MSDYDYTDDQAELICYLRRHGGDALRSEALGDLGVIPELPDCVSDWDGGRIGLDWYPEPCPGCGEG